MANGKLPLAIIKCAIGGVIDIAELALLHFAALVYQVACFDEGI
jgi:hypothetical protein